MGKDETTFQNEDTSADRTKIKKPQEEIRGEIRLPSGKTKQHQEELRGEIRLPTDKESLTDSEKRPIRTSHSVRFSEEPIIHIKTPECSVVDSLPSIRPPSHPNRRRRKIRPFYNPAVSAKYKADKHSSQKYVVESPELNFNYDEDTSAQVTERTGELAKPKNVTESDFNWVPRWVKHFIYFKFSRASSLHIYVVVCVFIPKFFFINTQKCCDRDLQN